MENHYKILILGDSGVGKTSYLLRYVEEEVKDTTPTIGIDYFVKRLEHQGEVFRLSIWDTAGQERFRSLIESMYKGVSGVILCFSRDDVNSIRGIRNWIDDLRQRNINNICVVATKADLAPLNQEEIDFIGVKYIDISSRENKNMTLPFEKICENISKSSLVSIPKIIKKELPLRKSWC